MVLVRVQGVVQAVDAACHVSLQRHQLLHQHGFEQSRDSMRGELTQRDTSFLVHIQSRPPLRGQLLRHLLLALEHAEDRVRPLPEPLDPGGGLAGLEHAEAGGAELHFEGVHDFHHQVLLGCQNILEQSPDLVLLQVLGVVHIVQVIEFVEILGVNLLLVSLGIHQDLRQQCVSDEVAAHGGLLGAEVNVLVGHLPSLVHHHKMLDPLGHLGHVRLRVDPVPVGEVGVGGGELQGPVGEEELELEELGDTPA
mmetsp:Transcript_7857/g.18515  ORF Transcript_7857/g.18515 Transcript_7857/m.18515 type:complete len:252 (-) Transcript_7857:549-1304(-)